MEFSSNGGQFSTADSAVFGLMLAMSVGIGVVSSLRGGGSSTQEYLLGGRNMSPIPVAISLLGGMISAISILGNATEVYYFGTQLSASLLGAIVGTIIVNKITLPILYNLKVTSMNEYLEMRFKTHALRKLATAGQLLIISVYMGMCLYAPSLALSTVTNLSTFASMAIMGAICTFYITIGGVKAVVYTDVLQTLLMFGGVLVVVILCCINLGGVQEVWIRSQEGQRLQFFNMDPSPYVRHTFSSTFVFGIFIVLTAIGLSQATYQRFASVNSLNIATRLCWFFLFGLWVLWILFFFSGLVAYAVFQDCDPLEAGYTTKADQIMPFLVTNKLGHIPGLSGLFVAAVYGGVLSSLSSSGNSAACLVWQDFLSHIPYFAKLSDRGATNVMKILSSFTGVLAVCFGLLMGNLGNVFHVINLLVSAISGPLAGVFLTGMLLPWANTKGTLLGFLTSFCFLSALVIGKFMKGGGSPPMLPLSTAGCPSNNTLNASYNFTTTSSLFNGTASLQPTTEVDELSTEFDESEMENTFYDVSYCYTGVIGVSLTMLISAIASALSGPTKPKDLCEGTVHPFCERLYRKAWKKMYAWDTEKNNHKSSGVEESVSMLNIPPIHHRRLSFDTVE